MSFRHVCTAQIINEHLIFLFIQLNAAQYGLAVELFNDIIPQMLPVGQHLCTAIAGFCLQRRGQSNRLGLPLPAQLMDTNYVAAALDAIVSRRAKESLCDIAVKRTVWIHEVKCLAMPPEQICDGIDVSIVLPPQFLGRALKQPSDLIVLGPHKPSPGNPEAIGVLHANAGDCGAQLHRSIPGIFSESADPFPVAFPTLGRSEHIKIG